LNLPYQQSLRNSSWSDQEKKFLQKLDHIRIDHSHLIPNYLKDPGDRLIATAIKGDPTILINKN
jgi:PIN domain nuclease of toxin-antitoxin system